MRERWEGIREDLTSVGDSGLITCQNVSFDVDGEARRRPGLGNRIAESGVLVTEMYHPVAGTYYIFITEDGTMESVAKT